MKKDILFLCQFFYPEYNSSATLPFDTAVHLTERGYSVDALCGYPKEYSREKGVPKNEIKDGVGIKRIKYLQLKRSSSAGRIINFFSFTASVFFRLFSLRNYKAVIVYSNPPVIPLIAVMAEKLFKTKIIFVAYDIYPEVAYASGSLNAGGLTDRVMKYINRRLYGRASAVVALTDEMRSFIIKNRPEAEPSKIFVIPNWAHENARAPLPGDYAHFDYGENQLIVSYFGNMGTCQDVETMLGAIRALKDRDDIQFLIVGHGNKKEYVEKQTEDFPNVKVLDFLTGEEFEQALAITDCGIVSLEKGLTGTCAPSKYYSYLQCGCAVLAVVEEDSYLFDETITEKTGFSVRVCDSGALIAAISELEENRSLCGEMKERAQKLYAEQYSKSVAMKKYGELIKRVLSE